MTPPKQINREQKFEMERLRQEKLIVFYYDMAKLSFGGLVIGSLLSLFNDDNRVDFFKLAFLLLGSICTLIFYNLGSNVTKYR